MVTPPLLPLTLAAAADAAHAPSLVRPVLILIFCLAAGLGTILLLPGRVRAAWRRIGGALLFTGFLFLAIVLFVNADDRPSFYFWIFAAISLLGSVRVVTHDKPVYSALYFVLTVFSSAGLFVLLYAEFMAVALITIYAGAILVTYTFVIMLAADAAPAGKRPEDAAKEFLAEFDARSRAPWAAGAVGFLLMGVLLVVILDRAPATLLPRGSLTDARFLAPVPARADFAGADPYYVAADAPAAATDEYGTVADARPVGPARGDLYASNNVAGYAAERGGVQVLGIYLFTRQMVSLQIAGLILTVAMVGAIVIARKQVIPDLQPEDVRDADKGEGSTMTMPHTPVEDNPHSLLVTPTGDPRQKAYPQN